MFAMIVVGVMMASFMLIERLFPRIKLTAKEGWITRAVIFNLMQLGITILGNATWERALFAGSTTKSFFHMSAALSRNGYGPIMSGFCSYLINSYIFYWWHLYRHQVDWLWNVFHQFHHSPERIEAITAFYKHPLEILANSLIMAVLIYPILGLDLEANVWLAIFSGLGEFIYHVNIKTPYFLGFIIQRPESHMFHHLRNKRETFNFADWPILDILGNTFYNPKDDDICLTGFSDDKESLVMDMLLAKDVVKAETRGARVKRSKHDLTWKQHIVLLLIIAIGCMSMFGYVFGMPKVRGIGFASVVSPLPLVFSVYNGVETFSTDYTVYVETDNDNFTMKLNNKMYSQIEGPYNRRNMYGVILSHGPFFDNPNMIQIRQQILHNGICNQGSLAKELGIDGNIKSVHIDVKSKTVGNEDKVWLLDVNCQQ